MFKLLVLAICVAYVSGGGLYSGVGGLYSGTGLGYGYGLGGLGGLGHATVIPYASSYANTYKTIYPSYGSIYSLPSKYVVPPSVTKIHYANPLHKLAYHWPTYLGTVYGSADDYSYWGLKGYGLGGYGLGGYGLGHGLTGYTSGLGLGHGLTTGYGGYGLGYGLGHGYSINHGLSGYYGSGLGYGGWPSYYNGWSY